MKRRGPAPVSVVIADDQAVIRDGLVAILSTVDDIVVVGVAQDGAGAVALAERYDVDAVLMDLRMPGTGGVEATRALGASRPDIAVVVLTTYDDEERLAAALEAGARGYLTKDATTQDIRCAVRAAVDGHRHAWPSATAPDASRPA
jgi:DNA-binding NarL/FixJ family response regulator